MTSASSTDAMVKLVDLFPTLGDFASIDNPESCGGASLSPFLREETAPSWRQHALNQYKRDRTSGGDIIGYSTKAPTGRDTERINSTSNTHAVEYDDHTTDPIENRDSRADLAKEKLESLSEMIRESID